MQISFLLPLASDRGRGEVHVWIFKLLKQKNWMEGGHSFSFISTPSKEQIASDGPDIVQLGSFLILGHFLDQSLTEDMTLCPIRARRYYLDKLEILHRRNMCFSSLSKMTFQEVYKEYHGLKVNRWVRLLFGTLVSPRHVVPL